MFSPSMKMAIIIRQVKKKKNHRSWSQKRFEIQLPLQPYEVTSDSLEFIRVL